MKMEWVIVKGISDYADGTKTSESWTTFASVMAASVASNILSDAAVFQSWPHYKGNGNFFSKRYVKPSRIIRFEVHMTKFVCQL